VHVRQRPGVDRELRRVEHLDPGVLLVPSHPAHLLLAGGTSIKSADLSRIDVEVVGGKTLVSIRI
jgi:hypothetical protein